MITDLHQSITYKNEKLFTRYERDYPNALLAAPVALKELIKFFWLSKKHQQDLLLKPYAKHLQFQCAIHQEMGDIDSMWHTFLLYSKEYQTFCLTHFDGQFIHHEPKEDSTSMVGEIELTYYLEYIEQHLGLSTLKLWFQVTD
ncbi:hypothetical protein [Legionella waltersii]|uniref:Uncharacterized protein n=1 Tax=Legionella waltersii TaxID=66969 RepID=A0A0W1ACX7_9GAMM|nr:hypothetical protein [Legionella waltersii]KTD79221.1 hypothetical protein Lwal_1293 [Legionella waltersii]SNV12598.1 Uncharacterized conserved protein [Legionella waltersii]